MDIARALGIWAKIQLKHINSGEEPKVHEIRSKFLTKQCHIKINLKKEQKKRKSSSDESTHEKEAVKCMKCGYTISSNGLKAQVCH